MSDNDGRRQVWARIDKSLEKSLRLLSAKLNLNRPAAVEAAIRYWIDSQSEEEKPTPTEKLAPTKERSSPHHKEHPNIPDEMVQIVLRHGHNPSCQDCIIAIGKIWDTGDADVIESLRRNCKTFARIATLAEGTIHGAGSEQFQRRVDELLAEAQPDRPGDPPDPALPVQAPGGAGPVPPVGGKPVRKARGKAGESSGE